MSGRILVSYASADCLIAKKLCHYLRKHGKLAILVPRDFKEGRVYDEDMLKRIFYCEAVVFLFSKFSNHSLYVKRELECAYKQKIPVVTCTISTEEPRQEIKRYLGRRIPILRAQMKRPAFFPVLWMLNRTMQEKRERISGRKRDLITVTLMVVATTGLLLLSSSEGGKAQQTKTNAVYSTGIEEGQIEEGQVEDERKNQITDETEDKTENQIQEQLEGQFEEKRKAAVSQHAGMHGVVSGILKKKDVVQVVLRQSQMKNLHEGENDITVNTDFGRLEELAYKTAEMVQIGDILQFGQYYPRGYQKKNADAKLNWIVLDRSEDGKSLLLLSEHIIDIMPFDVAESGEFNVDDKGNPYDLLKASEYTDAQMTQFKGNSDWQYSNIRTFLNSAEQYVTYKDQIPESLGADEGCNGYAGEQGFLYWFKEENRKRIQKTSITTAVNSLAKGKKITGKEQKTPLIS